MPWPRFRNPIQKLIVPTADLGLGELDFSGLQFPDDVPLGVALQAVQTAQGARIAQLSNTADPLGTLGVVQVIRALTTEGAGNTGPINLQGWRGLTVAVEVLALTGAPTNIKYRHGFSLDGGTTWYQGTDAVATTTGVVLIGIGPSANIGVTGNSILAVANSTYNMMPLNRVEWVFTAGAAPTVQHRITGLYR